MMPTVPAGLLAGRKAVVTGAGRGIGAAIARAFAAAGAEVMLAARSAGELETVAGGIRQAGWTAYASPTDMGDVAQVNALAAATLDRLGGIDIVVSNAAYSPPFAPLLESDPEQWHRTQQVNVIGTLTLLRALGPHLAGRPGANVIIVSSIRGLGGTPFGAPYGASKAVLNHLTKTLACEWGPAGIRVNGILPGPVDTEMTRAALNHNATLMEHFADVAPLRGWTQAEDMVGPALFLASDGARKVTGHLLVVDGGLSAINQDAYPPPVALTDA